MKKKLSEIKLIIREGAAITIDGSAYETDDLLDIAIDARNHKTMVHILNANSKSTDELVKIAVNGRDANQKSFVTFVLTN